MKTKKTKQNFLRKTRCYLIGHMQYVNGESWRNEVKTRLKHTGITFFDPYLKPFLHDIPEDNDARKRLDAFMELGQYDKVAEWMKQIRNFDLRLCDLSDFFIAHIQPSVASWGSAEEITTIIRQKKPLFLSVEGGKRCTPLWLMAIMPHKYIYNSVDEIIQTIDAIDKQEIELSSDRWKLLKPELR